MSRPLVSVVIPVRDGERYVEAAIASVYEQSFDDLELIVVDDGSTDGTADALSRVGGPLRVLGQEAAGIAAALNRGIEAARGTLLAFLDADDLWEPGKLALQVPALLGDAALDAVFGYISEFYSPELSAHERALIAAPREDVPGLSKDTMLIRSGSFERVGGFDPEWAVGDFIDWYARAMEAGLRTRVLPHQVALRRLHTTNMTRVNPTTGVDLTRVLRATLKRRREAGDGH